MKKQSFLFLALLCGFGIACQSNNPETNTTQEQASSTEQTQASPLSFQTHTVTRQSEKCAGDTCARVSLQTITAQGGSATLRDSLNDYVQQFILRQPLTNNPDANVTPKGNASEAVAKQFLQEFQSFIKENGAQGVGLGWQLEVTVKPIYQTPSLVSLQLNSVGYTGGAHGYDVTTLQSFDSAGHAIKLSEMVTDTVALRKLTEQEFRQVRKLGNESLQSLGFYTQGQDLPFAKNVALTDKGLLMYYNAYEVNAYAFGPTEILIPYTKLGNLLKPAYQPQKP